VAGRLPINAVDIHEVAGAQLVGNSRSSVAFASWNDIGSCCASSGFSSLERLRRAIALRASRQRRQPACSVDHLGALDGTPQFD
jgi:hypothetical protein